MKKRVQPLKDHLLKKLSDVGNIGFYLNQRSKFVHMGLDLPLYSIKNYPNLIEEINKCLAADLGFELAYPQVVLTVKWKYDYIIAKKIKNGKQTNK